MRRPGRGGALVGDNGRRLAVDRCRWRFCEARIPARHRGPEGGEIQAGDYVELVRDDPRQRSSDKVAAEAQ